MRISTTSLCMQPTWLTRIFHGGTIPIKLTQALIDLLNERTGPLSEKDDTQPI